MARLILLLSLAVLTACASHDEVARVRSPDGAVDAVLVESNGGALTPFWYDLYIVPHGEKWSRGQSMVRLTDAMRSEQAYGVNISWRVPDIVEAQFATAAQTRIYRHDVTVAQHRVRIAVHPGVTDALAPPGGMLYNRLGRPRDRS